MEINWLLNFGNNMYFVLLSYTILGAGLKYLDDAFDEKTFNKNVALTIAPLLGILGAYTILINPVSATILLAVLIGVLLKGKIDSYAHLLSFLTFFVLFVLLGIFKVMILPLIFIAAAAVLDEVGNDAIDYNMRYKKKRRFRYQFVVYFFGRRYLTKAALLYLVLLNIIPLYFLLALILFDEAYIIVGLYSQTRKEKAKLPKAS